MKGGGCSAISLSIAGIAAVNIAAMIGPLSLPLAKTNVLTPALINVSRSNIFCAFVYRR
jgi:hypothetical protein